MKLSSAFQPEFDYQTRSRGNSYYRLGAVHIEHASATDLRAQVRGTREYAVEIQCDKSAGVNLFCECAYFDSAGPCKHLWAAILAAESKGFLSQAIERMVGFGDEEDSDEFQLRPAPRPAKTKAKEPDWRIRLREVGRASSPDEVYWPPDRQLLFVIDASAIASHKALMLRLFTQEPKRAGGWKKRAALRLTRDGIAALPDSVDREIIGLLTGSAAEYDWTSSDYYQNIPSAFRIRHPLSATVVPAMVRTGRAILERNGNVVSSSLAWDEGDPWRFQARLERLESGKYSVGGELARGDETMDLAQAALFVEGLVFAGGRAARLAPGAALDWMKYLREASRIEAPAHEANELIGALLEHPVPMRVAVPEELRYEEICATPKPCLKIHAAPDDMIVDEEVLQAELSFDYGDRQIPLGTTGRGVYDREKRTFLVRDLAAERTAEQQLRKVGLMEGLRAGYDPIWVLTANRLPAVAKEALDSGWHLEAQGKVFRRPGAVQVEIASGIDWFELHAVVDYGGTTVKLPALLAALRRGETMVALDDGTYGLLPEEWLNRYGLLAGLGTANDGHLRFQRNQAGVLDALLASQPQARCDETFARLRSELRSFEGIRAGEQPAGFIGQLRDYQREGLGWMEFLRRFAFGGCLADDMGVGKTAQVLALLEGRRMAGAGPSLAVVPKSLVFNWKQEAARFTPELRVLDHTGAERSVKEFGNYDLILTTYGTLRRDAIECKDLEFDYVILDEAQAIKNAGTESAKAVRLLRGRHRLALSGTPVENHLGELWSLFEFLNPGMLGSAGVFKLAGNAARNPSEETRRLLAHALRPFILRRTKEQVARELPAKSEQIIYCELEPRQRKLYDELRGHYRESLLQSIQSQGMGKTKIQVLEALLRLRQAACHPGLLDEKRLKESSAKIDLLMERLTEVAEEGHKALVFSQFTSLLAIVKDRLSEEGLAYEYLDGATQKRQKCVERFQNDPDCRLFLISLKAGGLGLNLTAAEYVFLLDPWWNPAVEAQAVDRAHRIGQTQQVFAYRLIARDTVEEKVLQLQERKRDLAAAIISEDNSPLRNLQREDLELLLS